jgi:sugar/nucleoside kinase (ribokinase family)
MILVAGNAVVDLLHKGVPTKLGAIDGWSDSNVHFLGSSPEAAIGGNGASVAFVLGKLGNEVILNTRIGDDAFGKIMQGWLAGASVHLLSPPAGETSVNTILFDDSGFRRSIYFTGQKVDWEASLQVNQTRWFYASGYGQVGKEDLENLASVFQVFRSRGVSVMFDPGPWFQRAVKKPEMDSAWANVDCLAGTKTELQAWCSQEDSALLADEILGIGPGMAVIKQGADGVTIAERGSRPVTFGSRSVNATNTVGAGDTLNAGILHGLNANCSLQEATHAGMELAARAVASGRGAMGVFESAESPNRPVSPA